MSRRPIRSAARATALSALALCLAGCATVGATGRKQLILVSDAQEKQMGLASFDEVKKTSKVSADAAVNETVRRVGTRIAQVAGRPDFKWEFIVLDEPKTLNAFCLPGGKVAVYSGLLSVTKDDAGLAAVIGHEVAHALARHGAERVSEGLLLQVGEQALMTGLGARDPKILAGVQAAYGIGTQLGVALPHSRTQESEADRIGLSLMSKAGYPPRQAIEFWKRMSAASAGAAKPPEFLSTHPSDPTRIRQLEGWMPEAERLYAAAPKAP